MLAGDEGDTDVVIVKRAVQMASCYQNVMGFVKTTLSICLEKILKSKLILTSNTLYDSTP